MGVDCVTDDDLDEALVGVANLSLSVAAVQDGNFSAYSQRGIERLTQGCVAERLDQTLDGSPINQTLPGRLVCVSRNEDDRNRMPASLQFMLQIGTCHSRHRNVKDQALGRTLLIGRKEFLRGRECLYGKSELPQQVRQRFAHRFIVINHRNEHATGHFLS
jgi:hypothetical protein